MADREHLGDNAPLPYEPGGVLGRGGMGEVRIAYDPRLKRDVAVKTVSPGDPQSAARLAREAVLTAGLVHPGIMPVYAAGRTPDGRPWYAMRLFTGHSLAEAIGRATDAPARLALVRHVLDAAEAVAYAHGQGVIHRDLKPSNVLTGPFGETIVADWGLACQRGEAHAATGRAGTPGYMSPEQARGGPFDERVDVYGLGAILAEVLTGHPPQRLPLAAPGAPAELLAIAERALRAAPDARYPSARAFADDLLAWFEGRRVSAHDYSPSELLRRLLRAWRLPLAVATAGVVAVGVAVAVGWSNTAQERDRAEASEAATALARAQERAVSAAALRGQAAVALGNELAMEAELLAAHALLRAEHPDARGTLAAGYGRTRWTRRGAVPAPACRQRQLAQGGRAALCLGEDAARVYDLDPTGRATLRATHPGAWSRGGFAGDDRHLVLIDAAGETWAWAPDLAPRHVGRASPQGAALARSLLPGRQVVDGSVSELHVDVAGGRAQESATCARPGVIRAVGLAQDGAALVACSDGTVHRVGERGAAGWTARLGESDGVPTLIQALSAGRVLVGTINGHAIVLGEAGEVLLRRRLGRDGIYAAEQGGARLAIGLAGGELVVWDLATDVVQATFRDRGIRVAWLDEEHLRFFGEVIEDRHAPPTTRPHRLRVESGVSALAFSPDGRWLAVAEGRGTASLLDAGTGRVERQLQADEAVLKDLAFAPDGGALLAVYAGMQHHAWSVPDGRELLRLAGRQYRRVAWLRQAGPVLAPYSLELYRLPADLSGEPQPLDRPGLHDLEASQDGRHFAGIDAAEVLWIGQDGVEPTWRAAGALPHPTAVAVAGSATFASTDRELRRYDAQGAQTWTVAIPTGTTELAASPDGRWVAVGRLDGDVLVYAVGADAPRARLRGHGARVGALAFSPDSQWLVSGGWEGEVRTWSVAAFDADPRATVLAAEAA